MISPARRWVFAVALVASGSALVAPLAYTRAAAAEQPAAEQAAAAGQPGVASVERLRSEAYRALRGGQFDKTNELLNRAASISSDPQLAKMADWTKSFESQRQEFAAERREQYEKAVADVKKLQANGKGDYALDVASKAFSLATDKKAFRMEPWVDQLIKASIKRAEEYDKKEQWIRSLRLYSDLSSIEPSQPLWKERLKLATRRVRLLALYTPDELKKLAESESKEREEVQALLSPATQPSTQPSDRFVRGTTRPATRPAKPGDGKIEDLVDNDAFRIDWRQTLKGVRMDILWNALVDAKDSYYRETSFRDMGLGGLRGLQTLATTKGLEKAFPSLADNAKRDLFLQVIDEKIATMKAATGLTEQTILRNTLRQLERANRETIALPDEVLVSEFADGAFGELDPFTSMIWPTDVEEFRKTTHGEFSGVGIQIQSDEDGSLKVVSPLEDSPAYKAGIKAGDIITHINGKNAKGITLNQAVKTITGEKGTMVLLTVRSPSGASKDFNIKRDTIKVASVKGYRHKDGGGWEYFIDPDQKIAYLRMTNFTQDTSDELRAALSALNKSKARAIILDLRYNPGGLLTAATEVCDTFLNDGVIVSTRPEREGVQQSTVTRARRNDDDQTDLPLVVLVNQYSASASEIVSGALKDQKRATIVGERTFGKGSVQMLFPLADRTALLKLTTSHYYLPLGKCIHREENSADWGVDPDVTVEMTPDQMRASIDARQELDILRDINAAPAEGELRKIQDVAPGVEKAVEDEKDGKKPAKKKDLLSTDPQLSAALLLLRIELANNSAAAGRPS